MPHLIIEHSANVAVGRDMQSACDQIFEKLILHPEIAEVATKVRTITSGAHRIGTDPQSYAHATLLLLPGRDADTKTELAEMVLNALDAVFADVGSLSVDLADLDPAYAKRVL